jgi:hypothetical protein
MEGKYVMQCSPVGGAPWASVPCGDPIDFGATALWQTVQVPVGWSGWWLPPNTNPDDPDYYSNYPSWCPPNAPANCYAWHNPEFRDTAGGPQEPSRKVAGDNSQKYFTFYSLHEAGLYQTVGGIKPGARLRFSVYMLAWSTADNDAYRSFGQPTMGMKVGIDPYGGNNPWSSNIIWSPVTEAFDHWETFTVEAVARSDRVTVFTRSRPYFAIQHNDVYVDEASLVVVSSTGKDISVGAKPTSAPKPVGTLAPAKWSAGRSVIVGGTGGQRLRLRANPSAQAATVTRVSEGARLQIVEGPRMAGGIVWWKVRGSGKDIQGWASQRYLLTPGTPTGTPAGTATPTPKTSGTPKATSTTVKSAITSKSTATPKSTATAKSTTTTTPAVKATPVPGAKLSIGGYAVVDGTGGRKLRLRAQPNTQAKTVTSAPEGTRLSILDGPTTADGFVWWKVSEPGSGVEGWAAQRYLAATK